jgi:hypothetical protein
METKVGSLQKKFLIVTSFLEGSTGLVLMSAPSFVVNLLLGSPLADPIGEIIAKVGGVAVVSLALACWFSRKSESINGLVIALLFYNLASIVLLTYAGLYENLNGIALWPAVAIHIAMTLWSAKCLSFTKLKSEK